jgi:Domain of unknown function (DUF4260)
MALVSWILRSEAVAALVVGIGLWVVNDGSLLWLVPALLVPDLSAIGYALNPRVGAVTYNLVHNWTLALALLGLAWWWGSDPLLLAGSIVLAHVGMDRALGYGLKLPTSFQDTHLGRIGRRSKAVSR